MAKSLPIVLLDFETGGLDARVNAVTEIAAISFDSGTFEEISRYEAILKPYSDDLLYDPDALKFTGISMEMINNGIDFKIFSRDFISFLRKSMIHTHIKYRPILAGHNISFDVPFLQQLMFFMGKKIEDYLNCNVDYYGNQYPKVFDTLPLAMVKWPEMIKHNLGECINKAGFELVAAHRAMNDVKANVDLLKTFLASLKNQSINNQNSDQMLVEQEKLFRETFKF